MSDETWDYVVVGAGSSGSVVASRLSEDPNTRVLLLEAGPAFTTDQTPQAVASLNSAALMVDEALRPATQWIGLNARRTAQQDPYFYWRGKMVGGCSAVNSMLAIRGEPEDYDHWQVAGCSGWSWRDVLPYFIKLECDLDFGSAPYHGNIGPVPIRRLPERDLGAVDRALRDAALDLGIPACEDHNAPRSTGVSRFASNTTPLRRISTNDAYLEPARHRANIRIQGDTHVDRLLLAPGGRRVVGVRARHGERWVNIAAANVIVSAGAIHSPALLIRSGIGPANVLRDLGVEVVHALRGVGEQLQDHPTVVMGLVLEPDAWQAPHARQLGMCVRYSTALAGAGANDIQLYCTNQTRIDPETGRSPAGAILAGLYEPFSRGAVRVASRDPFVHPTVELGMLSDERDFIRMRAAAQRLFFEIGEHRAVSAIAQLLIATDYQGNFTMLSELREEAALDDWLRQHTCDIQHACGTCKMGDPADPAAVVDPDCRVIGVEGVFVCDASIMPSIPRANTHIPCVMIGEHVADRIRKLATR